MREIEKKKKEIKQKDNFHKKARTIERLKTRR